MPLRLPWNLHWQTIRLELRKYVKASPGNVSARGPSRKGGPCICSHSQASPNFNGVHSLIGRPSSVINLSLFCPILASNCFMNSTLLGPIHPDSPMARAIPRTHKEKRVTDIRWLFIYLYLPACSERKNFMAFLLCMIKIRPSSA